MEYSKRAAVFIVLLFFVLPRGAAGRQNSSTLYREGATLAREGRIDESIPKFQEAIKINPCYTLGHYGLGKAYLHRAGKLKDAIRHLERSVRLDARNARGHFYLGLGLMMDKKFVKAIHAFSDAYRYDASLIEALYNIGASYDIMGYEGKASQYYDLFILKKEKADMEVLF